MGGGVQLLLPRFVNNNVFVYIFGRAMKLLQWDYFLNVAMLLFESVVVDTVRGFFLGTYNTMRAVMSGRHKELDWSSLVAA
jgi:hypothetical protein